MSLVARLQDAVGAEVVTADAAALERHRRDWMMEMAPDETMLALARPRTTAEVAAILRLCDAAGCPVVPQGGLTGLTGGALPRPGALALSLERMNAIEETDPVSASMTVQAGVTLQRVQEEAEAHGMLFPLDLGGRGSCQVGGNLSTNAGGNHVLRYGMMRELVLGLEAVLPDGTVVTSLNKMLKNNAGYDIKQLFIGSEGTLGVVTRAVLRLHPRPLSVCTALCTLDDYDAVCAMLRLTKERLGGMLSAYELMWPSFYAFAAAVRQRAPIPPSERFHLLVEAAGTDQEADQARFERLIEAGLEGGLVRDAVVARSIAQRQELWTIRDCSAELRGRFWPHQTFDVSIPVPRIGAFCTALEARLGALWPEVEVIVFGHVADSNIHLAIRTGARPFPAAEIDRAVYDAVGEWLGSVSAEHGIGLVKKAYLDRSRSPGEIALMRRIKAALDPRGILNPGKVFDPE